MKHSSHSITTGILMLHLCQWFGKEVLAHFSPYGPLRDDYGNSFGQWAQPGFNDDNNYLHEFFSVEQLRQHQMGSNDHPGYFEKIHYQHKTHDNDYDEEFNPDDYHKVGPNHGDYHHPIRAAVMSHHQHKVYEVPEGSRYHQPTVVNFEGKMYPVVLHFNSYSSPLITNHQHHGSMYYDTVAYPQNEPSHHIHTMNKPVFHQVPPMISPYSGMYHMMAPMQSKKKASWIVPPASYL